MSDAHAAFDLAHLRNWIGRTEEADDIVTPRLAAEFRATFAPNLAAARENEAPATLHWCLTPRIAPTPDLGPDGHPTRGDFLPPVPLPRRMWAGGEVLTHSALRIGQAVTRVSRIDDVTAKEGRTGRLCFVTVRHEFHAEGALAIAERQDIVFREAAAPGQASVAPAPAPRGAEPELVWTIAATPELLFRYSAISFNSHRIHYDLPYVTGTEGYAGLVVHGPVQATLLFHLAATLLGELPARFTHRGLSPLIAGAPFRVCGVRETHGLRCWSEDTDGRICMEARAER